MKEMTVALKSLGWDDEVLEMISKYEKVEKIEKQEEISIQHVSSSSGFQIKCENYDSPRFLSNK